MKGMILQYLGKGRDQLLKEWEISFFGRIPIHNPVTVAHWKEVIRFFYDDLVVKMGGIPQEVHTPQWLKGDMCDEHPPLSHVMEVFLAGEAVFRENLLGGKTGWTLKQAGEAFEEIHKGFQLLMDKYVHIFCGECFRSVAKVQQHVESLHRRIQDLEKEVDEIRGNPRKSERMACHESS